MRLAHTSTVGVALLCLLSATTAVQAQVAAQNRPATASAIQTAPDPAKSPVDAAIASLRFRGISPAVMGGRVGDVAVVESNPSIVYMATASGGIWKTINGGTTFTPIFDREEVSTIGDMAVAPSDPAILYVGTGEATTGRVLRGATACTSRPTPGPRGSTSVCARPRPSGASSFIPPTRTWCTSGPWGGCGGPAGTAGSTSPPTGAPRVAEMGGHKAGQGSRQRRPVRQSPVLRQPEQETQRHAGARLVAELTALFSA